MNTEKTIKTAETSWKWVFYDAECSWCTRLARRAQGALRRKGWHLASLQTPWVRERLGLPIDQPPTEMAVLNARGAALGGADAMVELSRSFWWTRWLPGVAWLPGGRKALRAGYRWVAQHRPCSNGACRAPAPARTGRLSWWDGAIALLLPALTLGLTWRADAWVRMWSLAFALFVSVKWLVWRATPWSAGLIRTTGFLAAWPGMDGRAFLDRGRQVIPPARAEWWSATGKILCGGLLLWVVSRHLFPISPWAAGWAGMTGIVLCLHFGLFHLLSLAWRRAGVDAAPIMNAPLHATSLAEFWGQRWNLGFSVPARRLVVQPLTGRLGRGASMHLVFLISGLLHELVISVPAQAGFGLPAAYFALQAAAMQLERGVMGRWLGLGRGWRGWLFTMLCVGGPVCWLFHPPFVHRVILPTLRAVGAI